MVLQMVDEASFWQEQESKLDTMDTNFHHEIQENLYQLRRNERSPKIQYREMNSWDLIGLHHYQQSSAAAINERSDGQSLVNEAQPDIVEYGLSSTFRKVQEDS